MMENLWAVAMGHQTKTHACMSTSKYEDINIIKVYKQNYPNYQMQMMLLKPVLCLYNNKKWYVESQQIQPTGEQLSINVLVKLAWWNYVRQYSAVYIYNVHTCKFFSL
jgi:hypothetical protein